MELWQVQLVKEDLFPFSLMVMVIAAQFHGLLKRLKE